MNETQNHIGQRHRAKPKPIRKHEHFIKKLRKVCRKCRMSRRIIPRETKEPEDSKGLILINLNKTCITMLN